MSLNILRWLAVLPVGVVGWFAGVAFGLSIHALGDWCCPVEARVSGACVAAWAPAVDHLALALGAALAGGLIVALPALAAPAHRSEVAWVAFAVGAGIALHALIVIGLEVWLPAVAAGLAGGLALKAIAGRQGDRDHD